MSKFAIFFDFIFFYGLAAHPNEWMRMSLDASKKSPAPFKDKGFFTQNLHSTGGLSEETETKNKKGEITLLSQLKSLIYARTLHALESNLRGCTRFGFKQGIPKQR